MMAATAARESWLVGGDGHDRNGYHLAMLVTSLSGGVIDVAGPPSWLTATEETSSAKDADVGVDVGRTG